MSCKNVHPLISPLLDRKVSAGEREEVLAHLESCRDCSAYLESIENLRSALHGMNQPPVPAALSGKLRVIASHERVRQLARASFGSRRQAWAAAMHLWFDNLMRPLALPFAGGLLSALVCFSILVPSLSFSHNFGDRAFLTSPDGLVVLQASNGAYYPNKDDDNIVRILRSDEDSAFYNNVVWLTVDESGRVSDFLVERGKLTPDLLSIIMLSRFDPASYLGSPTSARVKVGQRSAESRLPRGRTMHS